MGILTIDCGPVSARYLRESLKIAQREEPALEFLESPLKPRSKFLVVGNNDDLLSIINQATKTHLERVENDSRELIVMSPVQMVSKFLRRLRK